MFARDEKRAGSKPGAMVISFDFELAWGHRRRADGWRPDLNSERIRDVIEELLRTLCKYEISATWATVGHLFLTEDDCVDGRYPYDLPAPDYPWFDGEWFDGIPRITEPGAQCCYAPDLVRDIVECEFYQELACHTFSHVIVGDPGCSAEVVRAELVKCQALSERWGRRLKSMVYTRNMVAHLDVLRELGFTSYRGPQTEWYLFGIPSKLALADYYPCPIHLKPLKMARKPLRLFDELCGIPPRQLNARRVNDLWEIPYGMFFCELPKFAPTRDAATRAIRGLHRAAASGKIFGLWSHPFNFLKNPVGLFDAFDRVCCEAARLREAGQLETLPMEGLAEAMENGEGTQWQNGTA